jgi:hypothetical protein
MKSEKMQNQKGKDFLTDNQNNHNNQNSFNYFKKQNPFETMQQIEKLRQRIINARKILDPEKRTYEILAISKEMKKLNREDKFLYNDAIGAAMYIKDPEIKKIVLDYINKNLR